MLIGHRDSEYQVGTLTWQAQALHQVLGSLTEGVTAGDLKPAGRCMLHQPGTLLSCADCQALAQRAGRS